jgi:hypothetical protein
MKLFTAVVVLYVCGFGQFCSAQGKSIGPIAVTMVELIANPEKFDGKMVIVRGFLVIDREPRHGVESFLYLHEEDAKNLLYNGVLIIPSEKMIKDQEKLHNQYVLLSGTLTLAAGVGGRHSVVIKDIQSCIVWSNPARPIGEGSEGRKDK